MFISVKYSLDGEFFNFTSFEEIKDYDKVVYLNCYNNNLVSLPEIPSTLESLNCSNNNLVTLPSLPSTLKSLGCRNNNLISLPQGPNGLPSTLKTLDCSDNNLVSLPQGPNGLPSTLEYLGCRNNKLDSLPPLPNSLEYLDCGNNKLVSLPTLPSTLKTLYCHNNKLVFLPISLLNCRNLKNLYFENNEIEHIPPILTRFTARIKDTSGRDLKVYSDTQSVHNVRIQECVRKSILNVLETEVKSFKLSEAIIEEILIDETLTKETKESLIEYSKDSEIHSTLNISFLDFLVPVWKRIKSHDESQEMKRILNTEMSDSICKCFTGRLTRLLNVLNGYYPDVQIEIAENDQIANIIHLTKISLDPYNLEAHKDLVRKEMLERDYPLETIEIWVDAIEEE